MNLYDEFERKTTATKITMIRKKPLSGARPQACKSAKTAPPSCGKRKRLTSLKTKAVAPPGVASTSSRRRGRGVSAISAALDDQQDHHAHIGGDHSADDDFADLYDSDGYYDSKNRCDSPEDDDTSRDGKGLQTSSANDVPMVLG